MNLLYSIENNVNPFCGLVYNIKNTVQCTYINIHTYNVSMCFLRLNFLYVILLLFHFIRLSPTSIWYVENQQTISFAAFLSIAAFSIRLRLFFILFSLTSASKKTASLWCGILFLLVVQLHILSYAVTFWWTLHHHFHEYTLRLI